MVELSFDPEAQTLYWYFAELVAGAELGEAECPATLLLDGDGMIIGLELELDESITAGSLHLVLGHPEVRFDQRAGLLTINVAAEDPAEVQPLDEPAVLDFDAADSLLGVEIFPAETFGLTSRLERVRDRMVSIEDGADAPGHGIDAPAADLDAGMAQPAVPPAAPSDTPPVAPETAVRVGFVALVGRPNVGKSTLLNALLGQKVAIVSPKPQTTRVALRGILNRPDAQVIFIDTPGIHQARNRLGSFMVDVARRTIPEADVVCFMVDISRPPGALDERIARLVQRARAPKLLVLNKVDLRAPDGEQHLEAYRALGDWDMEVALSARRRLGIDGLIDEIVTRLPEGRRLYPETQVRDQSEREYAAELVREKVLRFTNEEVPHGVAVEVEEWQPREGGLYIRMTIYVEKESQKGILIGAQGTMLKRIGSTARPEIEAAVGAPVFLDLWVKARPNWRDDSNALRWLGYTRER